MATSKTDRPYIQILQRIIEEAKHLQESGRLRDLSSKAEIALLEQQLKDLEAGSTAEPQNPIEPRPR